LNYKSKLHYVVGLKGIRDNFSAEAENGIEESNDHEKVVNGSISGNDAVGLRLHADAPAGTACRAKGR
jgi:hypothetical protein